MYIRHFEVVREIGSRWLSSALWDCFGGRISTWQKFDPQNSHTMHFGNHLDPCNFKVANMKLSFDVICLLSVSRD